MDSELRSLLEAVRDGKITDVGRCRGILADAIAAVDVDYEAWTSGGRLLKSATTAFISGWPAIHSGEAAT